MGGKRSGGKAHPKEPSDPRPLIERLLEEGYPLRLIAHETGVDVQEVRAIKASKLLPDLLAEHEDSQKEGDDTKLDATQASLDQTTSSQACPTLQGENPTDWRRLAEEDLEEEVLDRSGVIELVFSWLKEAGRSHDGRDSIGSALDEAQIDASKVIREQGLMPPIRLRRESVLLLHRIALWSLGKRGRGGSSKYRAVKGNPSK